MRRYVDAASAGAVQADVAATMDRTSAPTSAAIPRRPRETERAGEAGAVDVGGGGDGACDGGGDGAGAAGERLVVGRGGRARAATGAPAAPRPPGARGGTGRVLPGRRPD